MGGRRLIATAIAAFAGLLVVAPAAQATFHEMSIREVYPGSIAHPDSGYVELQMYASGQNFVGGHAVTLYGPGPTNALVGTLTFSTSVTNGNDQQTILIGDDGVQSTFGVTPDLSSSSFSISPVGGAACWADTIDCVSWGNFSGTLSSPAGSPADPSGIPDGMALRRTIAPGCATRLEFGDDTNSSVTDFSDATPGPRNNSSPITETNCVAPPPAPTTTIDSKPANPTKSTDATFTYHANQAGATFECSLDGAAFSDCTPGSTVSYSVPEGNHTFQVKATNGNGTGAATSYSWKVDLTAPTASITSHPVDPSPGNTASFKYQSTEVGSTFQCSLVPTGQADNFSSCASTGKTYPDAQHPAPFANGSWTFKVKATDSAQNTGTPASFAWTVNNSVADTTPPETTITTKPPDPNPTSTAAFNYASNEPNSTFECKLDGAAFAACPGSGIAYTDLPAGSHSFQVRATDASHNTDPTPAGYTFTVAATDPSPRLDPPQTTIFAKPPPKTRDRTPTFKFRASLGGATFDCKLDRAPFKSCHSPLTTKPLSIGRHAIKVRAVVGGVEDPTPAGYGFKIVKGR